MKSLALAIVAVLAAVYGVMYILHTASNHAAVTHTAPTTEQLDAARRGSTRAFVTLHCNVVVSVTLWYPSGDSVTVTSSSPPQAIQGANRIVAAIPGSNVRYFNAGCPQ